MQNYFLMTRIALFLCNFSKGHSVEVIDAVLAAKEVSGPGRQHIFQNLLQYIGHPEQLPEQMNLVLWDIFSVTVAWLLQAKDNRDTVLMTVR